MRKVFSVGSGILFLLAFLPYIMAIVRHQTVPSTVSWVIWMSVDVLALIAMRREKAETGQITGAVIGAGSVVTLSLYYGEFSMGGSELVSVAIAIVGVVLWQIKGKAIIGIVSSQIAILAGAIPTFTGAWYHPNQEDPIAWCIWLLSCAFALMAIPKNKWDVANALQPITFTVVEATMVVLVVVIPFLK